MWHDAYVRPPYAESAVLVGSSNNQGGNLWCSQTLQVFYIHFQLQVYIDNICFWNASSVYKCWTVILKVFCISWKIVIYVCMHRLMCGLGFTCVWSFETFLVSDPQMHVAFMCWWKTWMFSFLVHLCGIFFLCGIYFFHSIYLWGCFTYVPIWLVFVGVDNAFVNTTNDFLTNHHTNFQNPICTSWNTHLTLIFRLSLFGPLDIVG